MVQQWVMVKGSGGGGLGDRLRAVLVGIAYARACGRGISVDWRDDVYAERGDNAFEHLFQIVGLSYSPPQYLECSASVFPPAWSGRLHKSMHAAYVEDGHPPWNRTEAIHRYSFDVTQHNHEQDVLVMWDFDQLPKLLGDRFFNPNLLASDEFVAQVARQFIRPSRKIETQLDRLLPPSEAVRIGVHVRETHEGVAQKGSIPLAAYWAVLDRWRQREKRWEIVLATDNSEVLSRFKERYGAVIAHDKWFATPGASIHLNPSCPDKLQAAEDAALELSALARCNYLLVRQNSSFGMIAKWLSGLSSDHVCELSPSGRTLVQRIWSGCGMTFQLPRLIRGNNS
ncbi:MAG: hypothetical protein R3F37_06955 [Candidatus Competibacteraceae bacterium]